jgi:hypothetical protein
MQHFSSPNKGWKQFPVAVPGKVENRKVDHLCKERPTLICKIRSQLSSIYVVITQLRVAEAWDMAISGGDIPAGGRRGMRCAASVTGWSESFYTDLPRVHVNKHSAHILVISGALGRGWHDIVWLDVSAGNLVRKHKRSYHVENGRIILKLVSRNRIWGSGLNSAC